MKDRRKACTLHVHEKEGDNEYVHLDSLSEIVASTLFLDDLDDGRQMSVKHRCS